MPEIKLVEAVCEALREEMEMDERVFVIGEDVGVLGGYGATRGLLEKFGPERVRDAPISESGFTGLAVGAALAGLRPVVEIMYLDFITTAMDQVVNQAAKIPLMSGDTLKVPLVIRAPFGVGSREAAQHSQCLEAWFAHTPGLGVVMPSTPADAKGLLKTAIRLDSPVIFLENRMLYFRKGPVPEGEFLIPLGRAEIRAPGRDMTVVAVSGMVPRALEAAAGAGPEISVEVIDPRSIRPLDLETICASVRRTHRLLVVHEAPAGFGVGAEIVRRVVEECFDYLDAPPRVLGGLDTPIPFSPPLEDACVPGTADIAREIIRLAGSR